VNLKSVSVSVALASALGASLAILSGCVSSPTSAPAKAIASVSVPASASAPVPDSARVGPRRPVFYVTYPPAGPVTVMTTIPPTVEHLPSGLWRVTFPQSAPVVVP
jgi:hypothetical protein